MVVSTVDYHTAGEPFRIVSGGVPPLVGHTVVERRAWARAHLDDIRKLLVHEPRGHADMYGGFVTPPDDDGAAFGVVFFHSDGYSTACGHGTIAVATWAVDAGVVLAVEDAVEMHIDVPSGRLRVVAEVDEARVRCVRFRNVAAFAAALDAEVEVGSLTLAVDLAYGGAFYASVDVADVGCALTATQLPRLIDLGRRIRHAVDRQHPLEHPDGPHLGGVYGVIFHEQVGPLHQRNVTVFADGEVDRSPCGSGTSARLAVLAERGVMKAGDELVHESIVGTRFVGRLIGPLGEPPRRRWETEIEGRAARTGFHTFVLDPGDEVGTGFYLR